MSSFPLHNWLLVISFLYRVWQIKASTFGIELFWGSSLCNVLQWFIWKVYTSSFEIGVAIDCKWLYDLGISILVIFLIVAIFHQSWPTFESLSIISLWFIISVDIFFNSPIILLCKMVLFINLGQLLTISCRFYQFLVKFERRRWDLPLKIIFIDIKHLFQKTRK